MKCKDCTAKCVFRNDSNPDAGCDFGSLMDNLMQQQSTVDWDAFRREAAKDILCAFASRLESEETPDAFEPDFYSQVAIEWADSLIKNLQENKQ